MKSNFNQSIIKSKIKLKTEMDNNIFSTFEKENAMTNNLVFTDDILLKLRATLETSFENYIFCDSKDIKIVRSVMYSILKTLYDSKVLTSSKCFESLFLEREDVMTHSLNTAILSAYLAIQSSRCQRWLIEQITLGALLHDIGRAKLLSEYNIPQYGKLPPDVDKQHPIVGYEIVDKIEDLSSAAKKIVLMHHVWQQPCESYNHITKDFNSYPFSYNEINLSPESKGIAVSIVQTADAFESLTNKSKLNHISRVEALKQISEDGVKRYGEGASILIKYVAPFVVGDVVKLTNGRQAVVIHQTNIAKKPIVKINEKSSEIDLRTKKNLKILC